MSMSPSSLVERTLSSGRCGRCYWVSAKLCVCKPSRLTHKYLVWTVQISTFDQLPIDGCECKTNDSHCPTLFQQIHTIRIFVAVAYVCCNASRFGSFLYDRVPNAARWVENSDYLHEAVPLSIVKLDSSLATLFPSSHASLLLPARSTLRSTLLFFSGCAAHLVLDCFHHAESKLGFNSQHN